MCNRPAIRVVVAALMSIVGLPSMGIAANYLISDIGTLGGSESVAYGISSNGYITGLAAPLGNTTSLAILYDGEGPIHNINPPEVTFSFGVDVNSQKQVAGVAYRDDRVNSKAFFYDGVMHDIGTLPGGTFSGAYGINNSGQVVGISNVGPNPAITHAFMYDGVMHDLGTFSGIGTSRANSINSAGQITGSSSDANGAVHAFLYDGTMHDLGTLPGGSISLGGGISENGFVTGSAVNSDLQFHAFFYDGVMHDLGTLPGTTISNGVEVNSSGTVVGNAFAPGSDKRAFIYNSVDGMLDLNSLIDPDLGWYLLSANGINDVGQITGEGFINGQRRAFLLTPVPEASSLLWATSCLVAIGYVASKRSNTQ